MDKRKFPRLHLRLCKEKSFLRKGKRRKKLAPAACARENVEDTWNDRKQESIAVTQRESESSRREEVQ